MRDLRAAYDIGYLIGSGWPWPPLVWPMAVTVLLPAAALYAAAFGVGVVTGAALWLEAPAVWVWRRLRAADAPPEV